MALRNLQHRFLDYLRRADHSIAECIAADSTDERERRLSIYYNAYRARLRESIDTDHEILGNYLGDDGFDLMVRNYVDANPSAQTSLRHYCDQLPEFLKQNAPFSDVPILAELAGFERALMDVFDAADANTCNWDELSALPAGQWPSLSLKFHPSARVFINNWNSVAVWRAIKADQTPPEATEIDSQSWLLWRNLDRLTEFRSIDVDEYVAIRKAMDGESFASVCDALLEWHVEQDVPARAASLIRSWTDNGIIASI